MYSFTGILIRESDREILYWEGGHVDLEDVDSKECWELPKKQGKVVHEGWKG